MNSVHIHYIGVSEQGSCPLHWGQRTGFISITLRSENSFKSITLGSVNKIYAHYVGVSEQCSCPLYWGHWTMLMSITLHYMSVRACVRVCVSVRMCAYFHYQQLFSRSGMKGPTTFPTSRYVLLLSLPSDSVSLVTRYLTLSHPRRPYQDEIKFKARVKVWFTIHEARHFKFV